jgi:hypothetical protein
VNEAVFLGVALFFGLWVVAGAISELAKAIRYFNDREFMVRVRDWKDN